ncbi:MAG TPA: hypothetical protein VF643_09820, partial [Sphingomonas sp.]
MARTRTGLYLMTTAMLATLSACGGADDVASPGAGSITIVTPPPAPTPPPTVTPAPVAITAAQFASVADQSVAASAITADEQFAIVNTGANNNVSGVGSTINGVYPASATSLTAASDPSSINAFFTSTNFVGALNGP